MLLVLSCPTISFMPPYRELSSLELSFRSLLVLKQTGLELGLMGTDLKGGLLFTVWYLQSLPRPNCFESYDRFIIFNNPLNDYVQKV